MPLYGAIISTFSFSFWLQGKYSLQFALGLLGYSQFAIVGLKQYICTINIAMMPICNMIIKAFINLLQSSSLENNNMTVRIKNAMPITKKSHSFVFGGSGIGNQNRIFASFLFHSHLVK